jgi:hypothetical protein
MTLKELISETLTLLAVIALWCATMVLLVALCG